MGLSADFDDRQTHIESEADAYHPYEYQTENNTSWASALPVKQYVSRESKNMMSMAVADLFFPGVCMTRAWRKMPVV